MAGQRLSWWLLAASIASSTAAAEFTPGTVPRGPTNGSDLGAGNPAYSHTYAKYKTQEAGALGCQAECDGDARCAGWTYVPAGTTNGEERCCRFAFRGCPVRHLGCISGARTEGPCQLPPKPKPSPSPHPPAPSPPTPGVNSSWVFHTTDQLPYCHQGFVARIGGRLVTVFQANNASSEGAPAQYIFAAASAALPPAALAWTPGGTQQPGRQLAGDGVHPVWAPVLFEDPSDPRRVFFIYGEGAPHRSGGSSYSKLSTDGGHTFGAPKLILSISLWGGVVKATMDPVRVSPDGKQWLLAFYSLQYGSAHMGARAHGREHGHGHGGDGDGDGDGNDPGMAATGVLSSTDRGASWQVLPGVITDIANVSHFQEPTLEFCGTNEKLIMLFRTSVGAIFKATSNDGGTTWSKSTRTSLPNPDSRVNLLRRQDSTGELLLAYNPSTRARSPLALARSNDCGESWEDVGILYAGHGGYPTMAQTGQYLVTTFTRDGKLLAEHGGIGAVAARLPPPMIAGA